MVATPGTIASASYNLEIDKLYPGATVTGQACPMWCPLVENGEASGPGADYFINKDIDALMARDPQIDTIILGCTHYPLLYPKIRAAVDRHNPAVHLLTQGDIVADSLADYLQRHPEMDSRLTRGASVSYLTTENPDKFSNLAAMFMGTLVAATHTTL